MCPLLFIGMVRLLFCGSIPELYVLQQVIAWSATCFSMRTHLCFLMPGLTAALEACLLIVLVTCAGVCSIMTSVATLHQQRPKGIGDTSPAQGEVSCHPLAVPLLRVRVFR
jgi:hypothetical protein